MTQTDRDAEDGRDREKEQRGVKRPIVPAAVPEPLQEVHMTHNQSINTNTISTLTITTSLGDHIKTGIRII